MRQSGSGEQDDRTRRRDRKNPGDAVKKAMNLLLARDRSEQELRRRLSESGFESGEIDEAIAYVSSFGYINDARYAETYVASYAGKKSRAAMIAELRRRGIEETHIEEAVSVLPEDETEEILALLEKRAGAPHILDDRELRRHSAYLARRGYGTSGIRKAVRIYQEQVSFD